REQLELVPCPPAEGRWRPVAHATVLTYATQALTDAGYEIEKLQLGLSRCDSRFFGTLTLRSPLASGISLAVGLRSSLDKSLSLALKEWRTPSFPDFEEEKNVWRLFNSVTFSLADSIRTNPQRHAAATIRLGALLAPEEDEPTAA